MYQINSINSIIVWLRDNGYLNVSFSSFERASRIIFAVEQKYVFDPRQLSEYNLKLFCIVLLDCIELDFAICRMQRNIRLKQ